MTDRKRTTAIQVRVTEQEKRKLERQAKRCGLSLVHSSFALDLLRSRSAVSGDKVYFPCRARYAPGKPLVARLFLPLLRNKGHEKSGVPVLPCRE